MVSSPPVDDWAGRATLRGYGLLGKNRVFPLISAHFRSFPLISAHFGCAGRWCWWAENRVFPLIPVRFSCAGRWCWWAKNRVFSAHSHSNGLIRMANAHVFYYAEVNVTGCISGWQGEGVSGWCAGSGGSGLGVRGRRPALWVPAFAGMTGGGGETQEALCFNYQLNGCCGIIRALPHPTQESAQ